MQIVNVRFKKIKVDSLSVIDSLIDVEIFFNDGADKQILRRVDVKNPTDIVDKTITDIMLMEKNINLKFDGEKIAGEVKVVIEEEAEVRKKLMTFFDEITAGAQRIRNMKTSNGYLGLLGEIRRMEAAL